LNVKIILPKIEFEEKKLKSKITSSKIKTDKLIKEVNKKHDKSPQNIATTISSLFKKSEKDEIKKIFTEKLSKKEHKIVDLNFPNDIPTFDIKILNKDKEILADVDEIFLKEKAEALIDKLLEF
jgi:beta-N-acetylglucosaminidase